MTREDGRRTVAVAVCTYKRNEALTTLLRALRTCAERVLDKAAVGVVVVDDTKDGQAREVVEQFHGAFELSIEYRISGRQNISAARNLAIETSIELADWTAMTDDDCEPTPDWIATLLEVQEHTGADAVTGPMKRRVPAGSPDWLINQPFLGLGMDNPPDLAEVTTAATFNSMISSDWLKRHPQVRFEPAFGVIGGEDMVFFRAASAAGLRIRFSKDAFVYENEPPSRATYRYQLRLHFWHGNSSCLSSVESGVPRWRMAGHGAASVMRALARPIVRMAGGQPPQLRYALAMLLHATGKLVGVAGVRVDHR